MRRMITLSWLVVLACAAAVATPGVARSEPAPSSPTIRTVCQDGSCDFTAIQPALDAAAAGDEVRVSAEEYAEHLVVTRAVTLRGGWEAAFSAQTGRTVLDNPDAQKPIGQGRLLTATAGSLDGLIAIEKFDFLNGNATARPGTGTLGARVPAAVSFRGGSPADHGTELPALATRPGATPEEERIARLEALLPVRAPEDLRVAAPLADPLPAPTFGGAIFVTGASLRLTDSSFYYNVASDLGPGYGGAVAAEDVGRVEIRNCTFKWNTASSRYWGHGGAVYVGFAAAGELWFANNLLVSNQAGFASDPARQDSISLGGGLAAEVVHGARIQDNVFQGNLASWNGTLGLGGGLGLVNGHGALVSGNRFEENTSLARSRPEQTNDFGSGGGAEINDSRDAVIRDNTFRANVSSLSMSGWGGGMSVNTSRNVTISGNTFTENWGTFRMTEQLVSYHNSGGGGLYMATDLQARVVRNTFTRNRAAYHQLAGADQGYEAYGGGLLAQLTMDDLLVSENVFEGNVATTEGKGFGGAFAVRRRSTELVTLERNRFVGNVASVTGPGTGGAAYVTSARAVMNGNLLQANVASESGTGVGGGAAFEAMPMDAAPDQVDLDGNRFLENLAQGNGKGTGGGLSLVGSWGFTLWNNVLAGNAAATGGGASIVGVEASSTGSRIVANNTLAGNHGDGLSIADWPGDGVQVVNNVVVAHALGIAVGQTRSGSAAPVGFDTNLFFLNGRDAAGAGPFTVAHTVAGDPLFVDAGSWNFHLLKASPARDAGRSGPPAPDHDADGGLRPVGLGWDLGAFEWRASGTRSGGWMTD